MREEERERLHFKSSMVSASQGDQAVGDFVFLFQGMLRSKMEANRHMKSKPAVSLA